ncbi:MAG: allantoin permease [Betaproteobacteria bacterium]|nr:allantoin permease [Betaproteobacteria bacterium]NDF05773.1 allantoin permease [Betaproteobacteria bacterium]
MASTQPPINSVLAPVAASERVFTGFSHTSLWFSLGVGLLVIQIGAYLVPAMGTQDALLAILLGSLLGSGLVAWVAKLGCDTGLSSAGLMHQVYGSGFAKLPIVLNVIQLVGWTSFELVIMRDGTLAMGEQHMGWSGNYLVMATVFWGSILTLLMASYMLGLVRNFVSRFGLPLVVMSLAWLTWQFLGVLQTQDVSAFWNRSGNNSMGFLSAIDLVIAMPVSWLPLVADYARHGKNSRTAMSATWLGYALANIWCYSLGVLVVSVSSPDSNLVSTLLLAQGGLLALGLILIDELDNAYGDVYSASLNSHSLFSRWSIKQWGLLIAMGCTLLAIVLPMHSLEPFLLMLSSVFIPLYGVILGRAGKAPASNAPRSIYLLPALVWLIGIAVFHLSAQFTPQWGSALPSLAVSLSLAWLSRANPAKDDAAHA